MAPGYHINCEKQTCDYHDEITSPSHQHRSKTCNKTYQTETSLHSTSLSQVHHNSASPLSTNASSGIHVTPDVLSGHDEGDLSKLCGSSFPLQQHLKLSFQKITSTKV